MRRQRLPTRRSITTRVPAFGAGSTRPTTARGKSSRPSAFPSTFGRRAALASTRTKVNQVSYRPAVERIDAPDALRVPREQTTFADTTRGEAPRWVTFTDRNAPEHSPPSFDFTCLREYGPNFQRCRGAIESYGSSTPFR